MLSRKLKNKYTYIKTFTSSTGSKYKFLTETYEKYIVDFIKRKEQKQKIIFEKEEDSILFYVGIEEIEIYVYNSFFFFIKENSKTDNSVKIISAIYYRLSQFYGSDTNARHEISANVKELAERAVFYSLGIESYKERSFKWDTVSKTFIKHTLDNVFKPLLLEYMKTEAELLNSHKEAYIEENILKAEDIINNSGLNKIIPNNVQEDIIDFLNGKNFDDKKTEMLKKYLKKIHQENYKASE